MNCLEGLWASLDQQLQGRCLTAALGFYLLAYVFWEEYCPSMWDMELIILKSKNGQDLVIKSIIPTVPGELRHGV